MRELPLDLANGRLTIAITIAAASARAIPTATRTCRRRALATPARRRASSAVIVLGAARRSCSGGCHVANHHAPDPERLRVPSHPTTLGCPQLFGLSLQEQ